jgi:GTP1/Obg family GTP-binding protein
MEDHGKLVDNQMKLDTLIKSLSSVKTKYPAIDTLKEKKAMKDALQRLNTAEELMNDWMHKFEPDVTGKSDADAVAYFKAERIKIGRIDSIYKAEIRLSGDYLSKFRK